MCPVVIVVIGVGVIALIAGGVAIFRKPKEEGINLEKSPRSGGGIVLEKEVPAPVNTCGVSGCDCEDDDLMGDALGLLVAAQVLEDLIEDDDLDDFDDDEDDDLDDFDF